MTAGVAIIVLFLFFVFKYFIVLLLFRICLSWRINVFIDDSQRMDT